MSQDVKTGDHQFIQRTTLKPPTAEVKKIAAYILDHYTGNQWPHQQYKKKGLMSLAWQEKEGKKSVFLRFDDIVAHIQREQDI